jgi:RNA polymerase sigma-70 factor, ECF subfamily
MAGDDSMGDEPVDVEQRIRTAWEAKDFEGAATLAIEAHADDIQSFLAARLRSPSDGQEVFSMFAEDLWIGLPRFEWRCSMRTWVYTLARNAANRYAIAPHHRRERKLSPSDASQLSGLIDRARTATQIHQRTDIKDRFRALRERLGPDEQMLLILRIDRDMAWRDIAMAMAGDTNLDDETISRESARLRKLFERVKTELKRMAQDEGLLGPRS